MLFRRFRKKKKKHQQLIYVNYIYLILRNHNWHYNAPEKTVLSNCETPAEKAPEFVDFYEKALIEYTVADHTIETHNNVTEGSGFS